MIINFIDIIYGCIYVCVCPVWLSQLWTHTTRLIIQNGIANQGEWVSEWVLEKARSTLNGR